MIAVIDACAVLNLLQTVMEDKYFGYLESAFQKTGFPPKVFNLLTLFNSFPTLTGYQQDIRTLKDTCTKTAPELSELISSETTGQKDSPV